MDRKAAIVHVNWADNYISFIDNMLQGKLLQEDTRSLYVPLSIERVSIDSIEFLKMIHEENLQTVPVYFNKEMNLIRCSHIEVLGLEAAPIIRRKQLATPVLETYKFVPNEVDLQLRDSVRVNMNIVLEQMSNVKNVTVVEVPKANCVQEELISPIVLEVLNDIPLVQANVRVFSEIEYKLENVTVEKKELKNEENSLVVIISEGSNDKEVSIFLTFACIF